MWCTTCQQDVPGTAHAATGQIVCSRCQQPPASKRATSTPEICDDGIALDEPAAAAVASSPFAMRRNDWAARRHVRSLSRELRRPTSVAPVLAGIGPIGDQNRFDPPQNFFDKLDRFASPPMAPVASPAAASVRRPRAEKSQLLGWLVVVAGVAALAAGIALIVWPLYESRWMNWNLALGLVFGGQGALILGLVLVVSRLWRSSRHAALKLHDANIRLAQLQQTAEALTAVRTGSAPAFYADLARGASPQVLLANLKGQLDQLATRLSSGW